MKRAATRERTSDGWRPGIYGKYRSERAKPFFDLLAGLESNRFRSILDLGCGNGELTREAHDALGSKHTLGIDASAEMGERWPEAKDKAFRLERADIATFEPSRTYDLVLSNAALHWIDDHKALFSQITRWVAPGGELAVQMPLNFGHPSHAIALEVAGRPRHKKRMGGYVREIPMLEPEAYARVFRAEALTHLRARIEIYMHELASREDVVTWVSGSLLSVYRARMSPEHFEAFVSEYRERLFAVLPDERPFLYPFRRLFLWARKPTSRKRSVTTPKRGAR